MDSKRLERIEDKIDKISGHMANVDVTLASQHVSLEHHIRRTAILEDQIKPLNKHKDRVEGALKLLGVLAVIFELYKAMK